MTGFVTFALGTKGGYFFNSPTHWAWRNLPPDVEALFTKSPPIKDVLAFALGDSGTYFISYRDHDGQILCRHYNLPNPLTTYLYHSHPHVIRDISTLSISLGPYESYYAHDKTSASWANLPPALDKAIQTRLESHDAWKTTWKAGGGEAPSFVSLGADGSYFMRTVGGGGSWDLKSKEEGMQGTNKYLENSSSFNEIAGLYLFPAYPQCYILLLTSGKAFSNLPEFTWEDYNKMAGRLPKLVQTAAPIPAIPQAQLPSQASAFQPLQQPLPQQQQPNSTNSCLPGVMQPAHYFCPQTLQYTTPIPGVPILNNNQGHPYFHSAGAPGGAVYSNGQQPANLVFDQNLGMYVQR